MLKLLTYYAKRPYHFFRTGVLEGIPAKSRARKALRDLTLIGITGTDGKTTTSTLLYHLLTTAGIKTGLISTVGGYVGTKVLDTGLHVTSPGPKDLYKLITKMKKAGCTHIVLEATSHGLYQYRFWGIRPSIAGVTNVTHEHLDYHQNWEEYAKAKFLLLSKAKSAYINMDDNSRSFFLKQNWSKKTQLHKYSLESPLPKSVKKAITTRFPQDYNQSNAMLAVSIATELGVSTDILAKGISSFEGVPGRMEIVAQKPIQVIVDFAHTPNSLERLLTNVRPTVPSGNKLIVVFGCAGLRDTQKRPLMGEIAARLADVAIFTAEDPRTENIWSIFRQMKGGVTQNHNTIVTIPDREEAIRFAIQKTARTGDTVLICGKGHERSMCDETGEHEWHDPTVAQRILEEK